MTPTHLARQPTTLNKTNLWLTTRSDSQSTTNGHRVNDKAPFDLLAGDDKDNLQDCPVLTAAAYESTTTVASVEPVDNPPESANVTGPSNTPEPHYTVGDDCKADYSDANIASGNTQLPCTVLNLQPGAGALEFPAVHPAILIRKLAEIRPGVTHSDQQIQVQMPFV